MNFLGIFSSALSVFAKLLDIFEASSLRKNKSIKHKNKQKVKKMTDEEILEELLEDSVD